MKLKLIASLLFAATSVFATEAAVDVDVAGRLPACAAGSMACTAEYDPHVCDIVWAHNGELVTRSSGSNRCQAMLAFRDRQCAAHQQDPVKYADSSAFSSENCRKN